MSWGKNLPNCPNPRIEVQGALAAAYGGVCIARGQQCPEGPSKASTSRPTSARSCHSMDGTAIQQPPEKWVIRSYTHPTTHHTQKKEAKKWIKKWHEVAHKKVWCKNGISNEAKASPHEERASFRALNSRLYGMHGPSKSPNRYLVDLGTLSLVGRSHIKYSNFVFGRDIMSHECSVIVWPTLAGKTRNKTLRTLQSIWEFHGVATCVQLLDWQEIHRNFTLQHGPFFERSTKCLPRGNHRKTLCFCWLFVLPHSSSKPRL